MFHLSTQPTFSIMGPSSSAGHDDLFRDPYPVLDKNDQGMFHHAGMSIPFYMSKAKNQKGLVVGCSGLTSHYLLSEEEIKDLNDNGLSVIWMALPLTRTSKNFMPRFTKLAEAFFTHPNSPVFREFPDPNITRWTMEHSTGVQIMFKMLHDSSIRERMKAIYSGGLHVAGYFDSAWASLEYPEWMQKEFRKYCERNKDKIAGEGLIGSAYVHVMAAKEHYARRFKGEDDKAVQKVEPLPKTGNIFHDLYNEFTRSANGNAPTYGQVLEDMAAGRTLRGEFNGSAVNIYPHVFVSDPKDRFACTKTTIKIANTIAGAKILLTDSGGHEPLKNHSDLRHNLIDMVHDCIRLKEKARSAFQSVPVHDIYAIKEPLPIDLSDRARLTLKGGASLLYAGASFAQGLLAGRIGNPEVW